MLRLIGLEGFENKNTTLLPADSSSVVAIARALVNEPKVLLLDEPLAALDLKLRKEMQYELKRIQQEVGITFIFVTHDQEEALTMSDKIVVMKAERSSRSVRRKRFTTSRQTGMLQISSERAISFRVSMLRGLQGAV